ncbi:MAG: hypothetical protein M3O50_20335 [Myxococcota bacterium]|nr:hypothetical protein [Myxococcota bacterium]
MQLPTLNDGPFASGLLLRANAPPIQSQSRGSEGSPAPLPEPTVGISSTIPANDLGAELAMLAVVAGQKARESAEHARDLFASVQARQEEAQIAAMRQKADQIQAGALVSGLFTIGDGLTQAVSGWCSFEGATTTNTAAEARWQLDSKLAATFGTCLQGTASIASGFYGAAQESSETLVTEGRFAADHAKTAADDMHDAAKEADTAIRAAVEFYREYSSTQNQSLLAALHRT